MPKPTALLRGFEKTVETVRVDPARRQVIFDESTAGLALIVSPRGKKTYTVVTRDARGKRIWKAIGQPGLITVADARAKARLGIARIKAGEAVVFPEERPVAPSETFRTVAERFVLRWVAKGGRTQDGVPLRSRHVIERQLQVYVYPRWGDLPFLSIRRGLVTELMDHIVDNHGPVQADRVLATLSKLFNWYRQYDEDFVAPIIPEMRRSGSYADRARTRILTDDEVRAVWAACDRVGTFGGIVKLALLTAQRRAKVAGMRWDDIADDGTWTIPAEPREKANAGKLTLPPMAREILAGLPRVEGNPLVFVGRGGKPFGDFSLSKLALHALAPIAPWTVHDLRRTARSLMSRAGVRPDIAERVLGHTIRGVEGVYDRHSYDAEKTQALEALAALVCRILGGETDNIVPLRGPAR